MVTQQCSNVPLLTGDGAGECADVLTCGVCQKDFLLADILRFIQHKVHNCQAPSAPCGQDASSGEQDAPASAPPSATRDHNGDVGSEGPSNPASPATVTGDGDDSKADEKRKRDDEDDAPARKKPRSTQDAEANTTDSGEYSAGAVLGMDRLREVTGFQNVSWSCDEKHLLVW